MDPRPGSPPPPRHVCVPDLGPLGPAAGAARPLGLWQRRHHAARLRALTPRRPDDGWFGYLYLALIPGAFVQLPLWQRIPANTFPAITAGLAYFGFHPEYLAHQQAASSLSYLVFAAALSIGLGVVLYGVVHRAYLQAVTLARTSAALESLNRELEARADEQARDLRALAGEATQVRENERTRIARELHDELGQELTAARMALTLARRRQTRDPDVLSQSLSELESLLARTAQTTRDLLSQLRPRAVEELGLGPAVERLVAELNDKTGVPIRCEVSGELADLDPSVERPSIVSCRRG